MQPGGLIGIRRHFSGPSTVVYIVAVSESAKARARIKINSALPPNALLTLAA